LGRVPCYHFWMKVGGACVMERGTAAEAAPTELVASGARIGGTISLRVGQTDEVEWYYGHIGYGVYPPARGQRYAERSCRLLLDLARRHDLNPLWITTDPANGASRRTCERLGALLVEIVDVPWGHPLHSLGQKRKCRFRLEL
jgi:tagatose 1,6-diphosphate aldolase